jgi:peroxiredoxin
MSALTLALEMYFAALLGISGLAKIDDPQYFINVLRQERLLPSRSIPLVGRILPWGELVFAVLLIMGIGPFYSALFLVAFFAVLLGVKCLLFVTGRTEDCGCYGSAKPERIDGASLGVSFLFLLFAFLHLWIMLSTPPVNGWWRLVAGSLLALSGAYLIKGMIAKRKRSQRTSLVSPLDLGGLQIGEQVPDFTAIDQHGNMVRLGSLQGKRHLLLFVLPGCSACPGALAALHRVLIEKPDLIGLVVTPADFARNKTYAAEYQIALPLLTVAPGFIETRYKVQVFPWAMVIDNNGIVQANGGAMSYELLYGLVSLSTSQSQWDTDSERMSRQENLGDPEAQALIEANGKI